MSDMNRICIHGRLGMDAKKVVLAEGLVKVDLVICNNIYYKKEEYCNFFYTSLFGDRAQNLLPYLKKGQAVNIEGILKQDRWEKEGKQFSKNTIITEKIFLVGRKADSEKEETPSAESVDFTEDIPEDFVNQGMF